MTTVADDAIAVVGLAGRFPGAREPGTFWQNTLDGRNCVTRRTDAAGAVLWARGELEDIASFDPAFFGMSPREALVLDPQHRMLLECAWEALADASVEGMNPIRRTAVFAGANYSGYRDLLQRADTQVSALEFDSGTDKDFLATRIAYRLGLQGPCITVQTACSSSLVAVHLGSQALLEYEADQALAGGVSIVLPHAPGWRFEPQGIHSVDGVCRPFDADANGTVMGDGAGMVVLRRLDDAIADGCRIYAVLRGSAVNNDGERKIGYAAPSVAGQAEVIRAAQASAGIDPGEIGYVEAHGTGTPLGDRVELQALTDAFTATGMNGQRCALGSAKGAIGHLDVAAGVVGLIRSALALHHAVIPGTVNHRRPHPDLAIEHTPFHVPRAPLAWPGAGPRRSAVSSFGVGGTNAHVLLEEYRRPAMGVRRWRTLGSEDYRPERYWPATVPATQATPAAAQSVEYRRAVWCEWPAAGSTADRPAYSRIILLTDADNTGDTLHDCLRAHGQNVVRVLAAGGSSADSRPEPRVRPDIPEDYRRLFQQLPSTEGPSLIVCAWGLAADPRESRRGYDALTALAPGWLAGDRPGGSADVILFSRGVYRLLGDELGDPALAAVTGLAKVLSMEAPSIRIRTVDLPSVDASALTDAARTALVWSTEPLLVRRGGRWWYRQYERIESLAVTVAPDNATSDTGVSAVLGVGQVGATVARLLARAGDTVVLVARPGPGVDRAADLARELRSSAAAVYVESCDLAHGGQVEALLVRLAGRFNRLHRVVLAAGISGEQAYQDSAHLPGWESEQHFGVKLDGVAALGAATTRYDIHRVVVMSSLAGVLGAISLGPYSAAAAAMDSYADHFDGPCTGWLSIGWDAWQHTNPIASARERRMVRDGLTADEAEAALSRLVLSDTTGHVLVVKGDFASRWDRFVRQPLRRRAHHAPGPVSAAGTLTGTDVARQVLDAWRTCLADPALDLDDDLLQRGADSLTSIEVLDGLGGRLGVSLPTDLIFQAPTARLLASRVTDLLRADAHHGVNQEAVRSWHTAGPAVWCLHPISGSADCFGPLAELLDGWRVRAVVGEALADVRSEETIEDQARRYHALLTVSAGPPAVLVGWSYGGILAFEAAHLTYQATGRLPTVVLLDIPAPTSLSRRSIADIGDAEIVTAIASHRAREIGRHLTVDVSRLRHATDQDAMAYALDRLRADQVFPAGFTDELARRLTAGYRRRIQAVERYRPLPYPGHVVVLRASEPEFGATTLLDGVLPIPTDDPSWGWAGLAERGCEVHVLHGHHATLLLPPSVRTVADIVRRAGPTVAED